ncbi:MAG: metallophosphoesterase [Burkholderiaceae bacterium]|nr:metallophosphoesterase [Burkholderiaceae bacterium]
MNIKSTAFFITVTSTLLMAGCGGSDSQNTVCTGTEQAPKRLFLQQLTENSVIIKWRGDATIACIGTDISKLGIRVEAVATEGDHKEAKFTGLKPDTAYYYSLGGALTAPTSQFFKTAPASAYPVDDGNVRIWVLGDSGTAGYIENTSDKTKYSGIAEAVRQGMQNFTNADKQKIDLLLMLGDNAYNNGSDINYQAGLFDIYKSELKNVALWPTIGNHEMGLGSFATSATTVIQTGGVSTSPDPKTYKDTANASTSLMPYLNIFSLPKAVEAGGIPSGTKQYYSFNYGKVHIVSLDSQLTARDTVQRGIMKDWLVKDLQAATTTADWIVVIFHHPPYSKGANHDSDSDGLTVSSIDKPQIDMRNDFVPVFQNYGVDLVLNGHSHSYERSYYLKNLYAGAGSVTNGNSTEFIANAHTFGPLFSGRTAHGEEYTETDGNVVYAVAGNGGKADSDAGSMRVAGEWLNHMAHVLQPFWQFVSTQISGTSKSGQNHKNGLAVPGSMLIDANKNRLDVRFLNTKGETLDQFAIKKK